MIDLRRADLLAAEVCDALDLRPHPEGGHYREVWRDPAEPRGAVSTIAFLLAAGERSHWHRVDAAEIWLWQGGTPAQLDIHVPGGPARTVRLGPDLAAGEVLQAVVPRDAWQSAVSLGAWSLFACVVAPAFAFAGFELAPAGWSPDRELNKPT